MSCYTRRRTNWNLKCCWFVRQRALMFTIMWLAAHAQKEHGCGSSTWWPAMNTGIALKIRGFTLFYGRWNCPGLLRCGVILLHDNVSPHTAKQTRKLLKTFLLGNVWNFPMKSGFGTQPLPSVSRLKGTFPQDIVSPAMKTSSMLPGMTVYASELDKLTIRCGKYLKPSSGCVEILLTKDTFILYCQLPLFNSCLWFIDTVNLISGPLSYYKVYGKRSRRNDFRQLIRLVHCPSASRLERYSFTSLTIKGLYWTVCCRSEVAQFWGLFTAFSFSLSPEGCNRHGIFLEGKQRE